MGAHTLGRFHQRESAHKYVWATDFASFNNQYYRNVVGKPDWFFDDDACTKVGHPQGASVLIDSPCCSRLSTAVD